MQIGAPRFLGRLNVVASNWGPLPINRRRRSVMAHSETVKCKPLRANPDHLKSEGTAYIPARVERVSLNGSRDNTTNTAQRELL